MYVPRRKIAIPQDHYECGTCGQILKNDQKHDTVKRIVRPNNTYGDAGPGEEVFIEVKDLGVPVELATMSVEEYQARQEQAKKPKPVKKGRLAEMVDHALISTKAGVDAAIATGKRALEWERQKAIEAGNDIPKNAPAYDTEKSVKSRELLGKG
jgi:hypothetical protein